MRLVRFGDAGGERPGVVDDDGVIRDVSRIVDDWNGGAFASERLDELKSIDLAALPPVPEGVRLGPCVPAPSNFLAVGLNYADHARESNMPLPSEPILFNKAPSCISGPNDPIQIPDAATQVDWEVELAVVIKDYTYRADEETAKSSIAGYCVCHDISERAWQLKGTGQWLKGKSAPSFGPVGPWLVTLDAVADPLDLEMFLDVNGVRRQTGSTRTMIFSPSYLVSYISGFMALLPGDIITTGTPPGVGMASNTYLRPGDRVRLGISLLGEQHQAVVAASGAGAR